MLKFRLQLGYEVCLILQIYLICEQHCCARCMDLIELAVKIPWAEFIA